MACVKITEFFYLNPDVFSHMTVIKEPDFRGKHALHIWLKGIVSPMVSEEFDSLEEAQTFAETISEACAHEFTV